MNIKIYCPYCLQIEKKLSVNKEVILEIENDGFYKTQCKFGHVFGCLIINRPFELLFDFGIKSFCDGYYREATFNIASSLERYYEYYLKIIALKIGVSEELFLNPTTLLKLNLTIL